MKNVIVLLSVFILSLSFGSCNSDDNNNSQSSFEQLLTNKPAWVFDHYTVIDTLPNESHNCPDYPSIPEIEARVAISANGIRFIFYEDGTGNMYSPSPYLNIDMQWDIFDGNRLRIMVEDEVEVLIYENLNVTTNNFSYEDDMQSTHGDGCVVARHYGKLTYKAL
jgi:hypothetical protein